MAGDPLTDEELDAIERDHAPCQEHEHALNGYCHPCFSAWPCQRARLVRALRQARQERGRCEFCHAEKGAAHHPLDDSGVECPIRRYAHQGVDLAAAEERAAAAERAVGVLREALEHWRDSCLEQCDKCEEITRLLTSTTALAPSRPEEGE